MAPALRSDHPLPPPPHLPSATLVTVAFAPPDLRPPIAHLLAYRSPAAPAASASASAPATSDDPAAAAPLPPPPFRVVRAKSALWNYPLAPGNASCTRFTVVAAVAAAPNAFTCEVLYDLADLRLPPDLILPAPLAHLRLTQIEPLLRWDPADETNLLKVFLFLQKSFVIGEVVRIRRFGWGGDKLESDLAYLMDNHAESLECSARTHPETGVALSIDVRFALALTSPLPPAPQPSSDADQSAGGGDATSAPLSAPPPYRLAVHLVYSVDPQHSRSLDAMVAYDPRLVALAAESASATSTTPATTTPSSSSSSSSSSPPPPIRTPPIRWSTHVAEFIAELHDEAARAADSRAAKAARKKRLVTLTYIVDAFRGQLLEYDDVNFATAVFYFEVHPGAGAGTAGGGAGGAASGGGSGSPAGAGTQTEKGDAPGAVVYMHFNDDLVPILMMASATHLQEGSSGAPDVKECVVPRIESAASPDAVVARIRSALREQIPSAFGGGGGSGGKSGRSFLSALSPGNFRGR